jgi:hypothetical protein
MDPSGRTACAECTGAAALSAYAACYHATFARAFDVPATARGRCSEDDVEMLKSDETVSELYAACEQSFAALGAALDKLHRVHRDLSWHIVPVLLQRSIETMLRVSLDSVEHSLVITRAARNALDGRPSWEALEAARLEPLGIPTSYERGPGDVEARLY